MPFLRTPLRSVYVRHFKALEGPRLRLFSGIYPDFNTAIQAIPAFRLVGYDNTPSARRLSHDLFRIFSMDYPIIFWLSRLLAGSRLLFDWGGNIGISYFAFRRLLSYPPDLEWLVNDVPAVVQEGVSTAKRHPAQGLQFTTSMAALSRADILLAAGSLHFIENPLETLRKQRSLPPHVLLNKVPVYSMPAAVTLQNMGTALLPNHLFNEVELVGKFLELGYRKIDDWDTDLSCHIPFHPEYTVRAYRGYYFSRLG